MARELFRRAGLGSYKMTIGLLTAYIVGARIALCTTRARALRKGKEKKSATHRAAICTARGHATEKFLEARLHPYVYATDRLEALTIDRHLI